LVRCPLVNKDIEIGECVLTVDVCDGCIKERVLSDIITENQNWREICRNCEYHDN